MTDFNNKRVLIIDDNAAIHEDFRKMLTGRQINPEMEERDKEGKAHTAQNSYEIDSAYQVEQALELVEKAVKDGRRYALGFVDVRMPPGWNGIKTIKALWKVDHGMQIVICTAYSDLTREQIIQQLGDSDNYLILKKPFDPIEVLQLASTLTKKWQLRHKLQLHIEQLEDAIRSRTADLAATLECVEEGIVSISKHGKVTDYNEHFLSLWEFSSEKMDNAGIENLFRHMSLQVKNQQNFLQILTSLSTNPQRHQIELELKNQKILELFAEPSVIDNTARGIVLSFRNISDYKRMQERLLMQATHDSLTQLPNRSLLNDRAKIAISRAKRFNTNVGILIIDLDNFKDINDTLGHLAGDSILKSVASRLTSNVRETDTVSRFGGDEFVVILSDVQIDIVKRIADNLLATIATPHNLDQHIITVTCSIGISLYPQDGDTLDSLLSNADAALYHAKELGRNVYQIYAPSFSKKALERIELLTALRFALKENQLFLNYQPLVNINSNKVLGVEVLIRWSHPTLGVLYPGSFISLAEESGLILPIGEWTLRAACRQAKIWQEEISPELILAVNISAYQFRQASFSTSVEAILQETEFNPNLLELELTESLILGDINEASNKMVSLKKLGVRFAMDDFGSGYASLNYLKCFPFDKIKIDKSFIDGISNNFGDKSIVEAIIAMSKAMGVEVLAEGVEKEDQVDFLRNHQGSQVQGYYFSPPVDENTCQDILKKHT